MAPSDNASEGSTSRGLLATVDKAFASDPLDDAAEAVAIVFALLSDRISAGEVAKVCQSLPIQLRLFGRHARRRQPDHRRVQSGCQDRTPAGQP
jgi:uncharacterized protein (DUF2267 family)